MISCMAWFTSNVFRIFFSFNDFCKIISNYFWFIASKNNKEMKLCKILVMLNTERWNIVPSVKYILLQQKNLFFFLKILKFVTNIKFFKNYWYKAISKCQKYNKCHLSLVWLIHPLIVFTHTCPCLSSCVLKYVYTCGVHILPCFNISALLFLP